MHSIIGSDSLVANTVNLIAETFGSPTETSLILLPETPGADHEGERGREVVGGPAPASLGVDASVSSEPAPRETIRVPPTFKLVFLSVLALTAVCGILVVVLASIWLTPTDQQKSALEAVGFAWKAGLGAIFGLIGGKVT